MARDLNELKAVLWDAFEEARDKHSEYWERTKGSDGGYHNYRIQNRIALATLAQGIVAIETEQRLSNESQGRLGGLKKAANSR